MRRVIPYGDAGLLLAPDDDHPGWTYKCTGCSTAWTDLVGRTEAEEHVEDHEPECPGLS